MTPGPSALDVLVAARDQFTSALAALRDDARAVDRLAPELAFRLDRFGRHHDEHAVDWAGTFVVLDFTPTHAARIAAARLGQLGEIQALLLGPAAGYEAARPPGGEATIGGLLTALADTDRRLLAAVRKVAA